MKRMHVKAGNHDEAILSSHCKSCLALKHLAEMFLSLFFFLQLCRGPCLYSFCSSVSNISLSTVSKNGMSFSLYICPVAFCPPTSSSPVLRPISFCGSASLSPHRHSNMTYHINSLALKEKNPCFFTF